MARTIRVSVDNLGGSVNDDLRPNELSTNESPTNSRNVRIDGLSRASRPGFTTFADTLTGGTQVNGISGYKRIASANDRIVINYNAGLLDIDPDNETTWSTITNTITSDTRMEFANFNDWLFCFNGVDEPGRLEGTTYSEPFTKPDSIGSAPLFLPAFGVVFKRSLWVSGVPTAPNTVFISKPGLTDAPADVYDFSGTINTGAADEILLPIRIKAIRLMAGLVGIFTEDEAFVSTGFVTQGATFLPDIRPVDGADGAVSQAATTTVENDIFYLTSNKEIKSLRRGFSLDKQALVTPISKKIKRFLTNNLDDDQSTAFSYYDRANKLYKLHVKSKGATFPDLVIIADIQVSSTDNPNKMVWIIDDAKAYGSGVFYKNKSYAASAIVGQVYIDENGLADDDNAPIQSIWDTKDFTANNPTTLKRYRNVNIFGRITTETSITATVFVDDKQVEQVIIDSNDIDAPEEGGIASEAVGDHAVGDDALPDPLETREEFTKRIPIRVTGKKIKIRFETDGINNNYLISHMDYDFIALNKMLNEASEKL